MYSVLFYMSINTQINTILFLFLCLTAVYEPTLQVNLCHAELYEGKVV